MQLKSILGARGAWRITLALAAAYLLALAFWYVPDNTSDTYYKVEAVLFAEALFGTPIIIACGLSTWLDSVGARRTLLAFIVFYVLFTVAIFYSTFTGEHDAQYQLLVLQVPIGGFAGLVMACVLAALFGRARRR